ncbi:MAG: DUF3592 domain-containing protein [Clostridia bacterium]|nr:DUF3592 domain-containing protein [Clostridia bacterium]
MGKKKKHVQTEQERLYQEAAARKRAEKLVAHQKDERKNAIILLSISLAMFLLFVGFFAWHTARMRSYELDFVRIEGTVTGYETHHSSTSGHGSRTYYYLQITYSYGGEEYTFTDRTGHKYIASGVIGSSTEIYVDPAAPSNAEKVSSSGFVSIICACFFAFFCMMYAVGMNILLSTKQSTFKKRLLFVWGAEILIGIVFLLLFWLGLPHSGFGEVFRRIEGAVGITVVSGLVLLAAFIDGLIAYKFRSIK